MGGYAPLMGLVRGNDCFSRFFDWGIRSIDLAHYFDTGFDINQWRNWFMGFFRMMIVVMSTYNTASACFLQRKNNRTAWSDKKDRAQAEEYHMEVFGFREEDIPADLE